MNTNVIIISGRLTKDPELKSSTSGMAIAKFSVAVDNYGKDKVASFFDCTAFGKQADFVADYIKKGRQVVVTGRHESNKGNDGKTYWNLSASSVEPVGPNPGENQAPRAAAPATNTSQQTTGGADEYDPFADE